MPRTPDDEREKHTNRDSDVEDDGSSGVSDFIRRLAAVGLSGFFTTESALRNALGDTVPKEWVDFAADQSERTRQELFDRLAEEFGKIMLELDLAELMDSMMAGRTIELKAEIRLKPTKDDDPSADR